MTAIPFGCGDAAELELTDGAPSDTRDRNAVADAAVDTPIGLGLRGAALFQSVRLPLFENGQASDDIPVVVNREGMIRVYAQILDYAKPRHECRVNLLLRAADGSIAQRSVRRTIQKSSSDDDDESAMLDVPVDAAFFHANGGYAVELRDVADRLVGRFPEGDGLAPLAADPRSAELKVVLVPVDYDDGGESRLPALDPAQVERMGEALHKLYPVSKVSMRVRETALPWSESIRPNGQGWDEMLNAILELRAQDGAANDEYYYGMFRPTATMGEFCRQGCVLGLSALSENLRDAQARGSIGLGYPGGDAADTFVHEVGHAHGRFHAPCGGAGGPDRRFPYMGGAIGVAGYDVEDRRFVRDTAKDFMGYCSPIWVSDYTWRALFTRITGIAGLQQGNQRALPEATLERYRVLRVTDDGATLSWLTDRSLRFGLGDSVRASTSAGTELQLPRLAFDHVPGYSVYVPVTLSGSTLQLEGVDRAVLVP